MRFNKRLQKIVSKKGREKISMLTCYDYSFAQALAHAQLDMLLVGDSLANVVLGMEKTKEVGFNEMYMHTKAVKKGAPQTFVIADMPYVCYQKNIHKAIYYAQKFIDKAGADAVKIEWFSRCLEVSRALIKEGIAVMGHIGLTPQTVEKLGGFRVQGKDKESVQRLVEQAKMLEEAGVFSIVLECMPQRIAHLITQMIRIPTIGIGSGKFCDGQVLVLYDMLGLYKKIDLKFVRAYSRLYEEVVHAAEAFAQEVRQERFPAVEESFHIEKEELEKLKKIYKNYDF